MKYIFIVQGEGRGHLTQAISLYHMLTSNGHEVAHVVVGKSKRRQLPSFFLNQMKCSVTSLESPNFVTDKNNRSVQIIKSILFNLVRFPVYLRSIKTLDTIVKRESPDTIINFYDFLGGLYYRLKNPGIVHIALAHQFLLNHSQFDFPKGRIFDKSSLLLGNRLAAHGASKILGLSFQKMDDEPEKNLYVVPPLLRSQISSLTSISGDHFLVYMVNHGYAKEVEHFHARHPEIPIHCFWDKKDAPKEWKVDDTLTFHQLDDHKFMDFMARCRGYLTTAGFESVCEAMYLNKPVLMVPVEGHYEQACNALDATKAGAGVSSEIFDLDILLTYLPDHKNIGEGFRSWCKTADETYRKVFS